METAGHIPTLKDAIIEKFHSLQPQLLDATFGSGGHSNVLLATNWNIHILAIDCDGEAEKRREVVKTSYGDRFDFRSLNFSEISDEGGLFAQFCWISVFHLSSSIRLDVDFHSDKQAPRHADESIGINGQRVLENAS
jgi:hypothetical protein